MSEILPYIKWVDAERESLFWNYIIGWMLTIR
jgi:hypothetical protein